MNLQNKVRTLLALLMLLFLMNIALITYIYRELHQDQNKDEPKREVRIANKNPITDYLKNEVHFSEEQLEAYEKDKEMHMQKMREIRKEIRFRQRDYIALLAKENVSENEKLARLSEITSEYNKLELEVFRHFNQIKVIATDQQLQKMSPSFHQVLGETLFPLKR